MQQIHFVLCIINFNYQCKQKPYNGSPCFFIFSFSCCSFSPFLFLACRVSLNSVSLTEDGKGSWCLLTPLLFDNDGRVSSSSMVDGQGAYRIRGGWASGSRAGWARGSRGGWARGSRNRLMGKGLLRWMGQRR